VLWRPRNWRGQRRVARGRTLTSWYQIRKCSTVRFRPEATLDGLWPQRPLSGPCDLGPRVVAHHSGAIHISQLWQGPHVGRDDSGQRSRPTQVPGPKLLREPTISIVGKRYRGFPSTNSPVNTPTYGAGSAEGRFGLGVSSEAHPASPTMRSTTMANRVRAFLSLTCPPSCSSSSGGRLGLGVELRPPMS
jgi:hypothetical protein